jgi:hypothetical protein
LIGNVEELIRYINESDLDKDLKLLLNQAIECELANRPLSRLQEILEEIAAQGLNSK